MNCFFQFDMIDVVLQSEKHKNTKVEFINEHRETFMIDNNKITDQRLGGDLKGWGRKERGISTELVTVLYLVEEKETWMGECVL